MTTRERGILRSMLDTVIAPGSSLPPPSATDAVAAFEAQLAIAPSLNSRGLRALLWMVELRPALSGRRRRFHRLNQSEREACLDSLERGTLGRPIEGLIALVKLAYFGDVGVMRALGYDADAVVARGRAVRVAEARW